MASLARAAPARSAPARRPAQDINLYPPTSPYISLYLPAQDINFVEVTEECKAIGQDYEGCELAEVFVTALAKPELKMETYSQPPRPRPSPTSTPPVAP